MCTLFIYQLLKNEMVITPSFHLFHVRSIIYEEHYEKQLSNQSRLQKYRQFPLQMLESYHTLLQIDTKEDKGKSMKCALHSLWYAIRHLSAEATFNILKHQDCNLIIAVIKLHLNV